MGELAGHVPTVNGREVIVEESNGLGWQWRFLDGDERPRAPVFVDKASAIRYARTEGWFHAAP